MNSINTGTITPGKALCLGEIKMAEIKAISEVGLSHQTDIARHFETV